MSIVHRLCVPLLPLVAVACGARSELGAPQIVTCLPLEIGALGTPGAQDGSDFHGWLAVSGADVGVITEDAPLTADSLQPFDIVVLEYLTRDYTPAEAATLAAWVEGGGGLVSMSGWHYNIPDDLHPNTLIAPLEVAYTGQLLWGPVTDLAPHPITAGLTSVVFKGGLTVSDLGGQASMRTPIAFLPSDSGTVAVGYAIQMGHGRAFVWGDDWIEYTTEGPLFQPRLWLQVFGWISSVKRCALKPPPS
jgi:hypothetical protein